MSSQAVCSRVLILAVVASAVVVCRRRAVVAAARALVSLAFAALFVGPPCAAASPARLSTDC